MNTYTIGQLPNTATEMGNDDYIPIWQNGATKKIKGKDFMDSFGNTGGLAFVGTEAEYEVAKLIPEGEEGFIPSGTLVCLTDKDTNLMGEEVE